MQAIVVREFGGPDVLRLETRPDPTAGPGQVVVRVRAAGVNPVEAYVRSGLYARLPALPYTPGTDLAGTVEALGAEVTGLARGTRVYAHGVAPGSGAYAERACCEVHQVHRLPDHISFQQGAALGVPYGTAWRALFIRAQARAGETVLVHGASGGVGIAAVQLARAAGLRVIGTAGSDAGAALVRTHGAEQVLNHSQPGYLDAIAPLTGGRGVDLVIEMLANVNLDRDLDVLALRGRVVVVGNRGRIEIDPRKTMAKDSAILGMSLVHATREELARIHAALLDGLEARTIDPVIDRELPLADAAEAHEAIMRPGHRGKIVLVM